MLEEAENCCRNLSQEGIFTANLNGSTKKACLVKIHGKIYFKRYNYLNRRHSIQSWASDITGLGKRAACSFPMPQQISSFFFLSAFVFPNQDRSKTFKKPYAKQEAYSPTPECFCCPRMWKHSYKQWKAHRIRKSRNVTLPLPLNWLFPKAAKFSSLASNFQASVDL